MSSMPVPAPVFDAKVVQVVDGDTLKADLDRHMGDHSIKTLRLLGVDCPEIRGAEKERGMAAKLFVMDFLIPDEGEPLIVRTHGRDKYGRELAEVWRKRDGASLGDALREAGHAHAVSVLAQIPEARAE